MNKETSVITTEQYEEIINTIKCGGVGFRGNDRVATALVLEGHLGMRIGDILRLRLCNVVEENGRYHLDIVEQKSGKKRDFLVPDCVRDYMAKYCERNGISAEEPMFPITVRCVQKALKIACDYLGYEDVGTHSFRKWYANQMYQNNERDILLVQKLLQHGTLSSTLRYIEIANTDVETAIQSHQHMDGKKRGKDCHSNERRHYHYPYCKYKKI